MEEILASIRRIIADDQSMPNHAALRAAVESEPPVEPPAPVHVLHPAPAAVAPPPPPPEPSPAPAAAAPEKAAAPEPVAPSAAVAHAPVTPPAPPKQPEPPPIPVAHGPIAAPQFAMPDRPPAAEPASPEPAGVPPAPPKPAAAVAAPPPPKVEAVPPLRPTIEEAVQHPPPGRLRVADSFAPETAIEPDVEPDLDSDIDDYDEPLGLEPPSHQAFADPRAALFSSVTDQSVASAFNVLAATRLADNSDELLAMTREMIRPLLKAWLDDNLPSMVERLVRAEIERVSRGGR